MKLGIIGTGTIIEEFLPHLKKMEQINVKALCSTTRSFSKAQQMCETYQIPECFDRIEQLLLSDIDTVYVALPNDLHYEITLQVLRAKKNAIVEKPFASNLTEIEHMITVAKENQCFLFEAITTIHLPNYKKIAELLPTIGQIKLVSANFSQYSSRYDAFMQGEIKPVFDPLKSGGVMMDLQSYNIWYMLGLFGLPEMIQYEANVEKGIDTSGMLTMKYPNFIASLIAAKDSTAPARYLIQGTKGYILQETTANICGKVTVAYTNGSKDEYDENKSAARMYYEFERFEEIISKQDTKTMFDLLEMSKDVAIIQTKARMQAKIIFPADAKTIQIE